MANLIQVGVLYDRFHIGQSAAGVYTEERDGRLKACAQAAILAQQARKKRGVRKKVMCARAAKAT